MRIVRLLLAASLAAACSTGEQSAPNDTGLDGLAITSVNPDTLVPGSLLVVAGRSFVDEEWGTTRIRLTGTMDGASVDITLPVEFVDYGRLELQWPGGLTAGLPSDGGTFSGDATVEV